MPTIAETEGSCTIFMGEDYCILPLHEELNIINYWQNGTAQFRLFYDIHGAKMYVKRAAITRVDVCPANIWIKRREEKEQARLEGDDD